MGDISNDLLSGMRDLNGLKLIFQLWEQQQALDAARAAREAAEAREAREARERHERDRADLLRKKHDHSANASSQVKQKLQVRWLSFILNNNRGIPRHSEQLPPRPL